VVKEINTPRMASLKGKMKAKSAKISVLNVSSIPVDAERLGLKGSPTQVLRSFVPERKSGGEKIKDELPVMVEKLKSTILDLGIVK
jgi:electron transfer flavoprotein beta subunit